jgi:acyl carrier protein
MINKEEIISELKVIVKPYINNEEAFENLSESTSFITDLQINSANLVDIILDIEEKYNIEIDTVSMEKMDSVQSALDIIETKLAEK